MQLKLHGSKNVSPFTTQMANSTLVQYIQEILCQKSYVITPYKENVILRQKPEEPRPLWSKVTLLTGRCQGIILKSRF